MPSHSVFRLFVISLLPLLIGCHGESAPKSVVKSAFQTTPESDSSIPSGYRGIVVEAGRVSEASISDWKNDNWQQIVLMLDDETDSDQVARACKLIESVNLSVEYLWEVARCPKLADAHPEWMASLQGHDEWRRLFPDFPAQKSDEVVKTYPWVPIGYQESFDAQLDRLSQRLEALPRPARIWLHDIQSAPSACGCGHPLCRWTGDYGPIHTGKLLNDSAAADFVSQLQARNPDIEFVPIWTTECEAADEHEACGGVGCFDGICWNAWARQLSTMEQQSSVLGVSCLYKEHRRDLPRYETTAGWIKSAISFFESVPAKKKFRPVVSSRLVAVLQGWDVSEAEVDAQISVAMASRVRGILLVKPRLDQSWQPQIYRWKAQ